MFNETDPELEAKATGLRLLAVWAVALFIGWCAVIAAIALIVNVAIPAAGALWRAFQ